MNGTSGFREVRSSSFRSSTNRLLREQQPQFGTGAWHLFRTTISPLSLLVSASSEKRFLTLFQATIFKLSTRINTHSNIRSVRVNE